MNVFDLYAKLAIDSSEYDRGLDNAESKASGFGSKVGKVFGTVAKVSVAAFSAAATGIGLLTKKSVEGYAEQQQLVGGIETLYGDFADKVIENANKAFVTAGKSANDYMETAITASAAMINSLGGDQAKAAELTDMAITDMADNVNKMGTSMEMVQNAYAGFSRSNFTMLDNLALGFAGSKQGMQELLDKAEEFSGIKYDISSYSDIVQAIHVVQEEMGITGTTSEEAAGTITGSIEMMKAAWKNLVTGMSDNNADLDGLVNNFVDSVTTAGTNLLPVTETALNGVATVIEQLLPPIAEKIPTIFLNIAPKLLRAGANVVTTLAQGFIQNAPMILQTGIDLLIELIDGLAEGLPTAIPMIVDCVMQIAEVLLDNSDKLIDAGIELLIALIEGFINAEPQFLEKMPELLEKLARALISGAIKLADAMIKIAGMMIKNFVSKIPEYAKAGAKIIDVIAQALMGGIAGLIVIGVHLVEGIWKGISSSLGWIKARIKEWVGNVVDFFKKTFKIGSPSKVMSDEVGKWLGLGVYEGWEKNNPIDLINDEIDSLKGDISVTSQYSGSNASNGSMFNYSDMANAFLYAMKESGFAVELNDREVGRLVRRAMA